MPDRPRILVIDDERRMLDVLQQALSGLGFEAEAAADGRTGLALYLESAFDLVLLDLWLGDLDGMEVLRRVRAHRADAMVVVITGYASVESAVQAMKAGALDYLTKPLDFDHLEIVLRRALEGRRQSQKLRHFEEQVARQGSFEGLVGVSQEMQRVYDLIRRLAEGDATALVQGETGTGKELAARAIHNRSRRRKAPFVPIHCGALPEALLESELFGHEKGAFTGAVRQKPGLIERAEGGTLFLDEIETTSPALQVRLLRTIQEREVLRVGGDRPIRVDFRLVAATNRNLERMVEEGGFRPDLFYRLNVVVVDLPPLRARRGDVPLLVNHLAVACAARMGRSEPEVAPEAMMLLKAHDWPGNVRELENAIAQAMLMCEGGRIRAEDLPPQVRASVLEGTDPYDAPLREAREQFERHYMAAALRRAGGRVAEAARRAGIHRRRFYEKMKQYGIPREGGAS